MCKKLKCNFKIRLGGALKYFTSNKKGLTKQ